MNEETTMSNNGRSDMELVEAVISAVIALNQAVKKADDAGIQFDWDKADQGVIVVHGYREKPGRMQ